MSRTHFFNREFEPVPILNWVAPWRVLEEFRRGKPRPITTHYANLKLLANELPAMQNANMQFDNRTLEPVFKLVTGEAEFIYFMSPKRMDCPIA